MPREKKAKPVLPARIVEGMKFWRKNPNEAVKDWFGVTPDDWQGDVIHEFFTGQGDRYAVKSAHGPGKTATEAWIGWLFLNFYDDSRVVASAPTMAQLGDILWPEYAKWHEKMPAQLKTMWDISGAHIRSVIKPKQWFAVARTSNKPANLQGFHNANILIQIDEASGVPQDVFEVIEGALSEAGDDGKIAKLFIAGNPNFTSGELFDAFTKNRSLYHRYTVTGDPNLLNELKVEQGADHPNNGKVFYSRRVKAKYVQTIAKKYGDEGAVFDVRVRGMFPRQDDGAVIPLEWAERAKGRELPHFDRVANPFTLVLDVARKGGNETVLGVFRGGIPVEPLQARAKTSTIESANMVEEKYRMLIKQGFTVEQVIVDEPGVGGGVIDELRHREIPVTPYNGGIGMRVGVDPEDECRMFMNRRARDYWHVRRLLELNMLPLPDDDVLIAQAASVRYDYSENEKIVIESKQKLKDRLGEEASPDRIDVIVMGCAPWYSTQATNTNVTEIDGESDVGQDRAGAVDAAENLDGERFWEGVVL
jgi:phage terminase large subunit